MSLQDLDCFQLKINHSLELPILRRPVLNSFTVNGPSWSSRALTLPHCFRFLLAYLQLKMWLVFLVLD